MLYLFRRRSWGVGKKLGAYVIRKQMKISPEGVAWGGGKNKSSGKGCFNRNKAEDENEEQIGGRKKKGCFGRNKKAKVENEEQIGDDSDEDEEFKELLDRLRRHDDSVHRDFLAQQDSIADLQKHLEAETQKLKDMLNNLPPEQTIAGMGISKEAVLKALLSRLKTDIEARNLFEVDIEAAEREIGLQLSHLQLLLMDDPEEIGHHIVDQITGANDNDSDSGESGLVSPSITASKAGSDVTGEGLEAGLEALEATGSVDDDDESQNEKKTLTRSLSGRSDLACDSSKNHPPFLSQFLLELIKEVQELQSVVAGTLLDPMSAELERLEETNKRFDSMIEKEKAELPDSVKKYVEEMRQAEAESIALSEKFLERIKEFQEKVPEYLQGLSKYEGWCYSEIKKLQENPDDHENPDAELHVIEESAASGMISWLKPLKSELEGLVKAVNMNNEMMAPNRKNAFGLRETLLEETRKHMPGPQPTTKEVLDLPGLVERLQELVGSDAFQAGAKGMDNLAEVMRKLPEVQEGLRNAMIGSQVPAFDQATFDEQLHNYREEIEKIHQEQMDQYNDHVDDAYDEEQKLNEDWANSYEEGAIGDDVEEDEKKLLEEGVQKDKEAMEAALDMIRIKQEEDAQMMVDVKKLIKLKVKDDEVNKLDDDNAAKLAEAEKELADQLDKEDEEELKIEAEREAHVIAEQNNLSKDEELNLAKSLMDDYKTFSSAVQKVKLVSQLTRGKSMMNVEKKEEEVPDTTRKAMEAIGIQDAVQVGKVLKKLKSFKEGSQDDEAISIPKADGSGSSIIKQKIMENKLVMSAVAVIQSQSEQDEEKDPSIVALHKKELANLRAAIDAENRRARSRLRQRLAAKRSSKEADIAEGNLSPEEAAVVMEDLHKEEEAEMKKLEQEMAAEADRVLNEVIKKHKEAKEQGLSVDDELARLQELYNSSVDDVKAKLGKHQKEMRKGLDDRIRHRRRAREAKLRQKGVDEKVLQEELAALEELEEAEKAALETELKNEEKEALEEVVDQIKKLAEENDPSLDLAKLKELHDRELKSLRQHLDIQRDLKHRDLKRRLAERRAKKLAELQKKKDQVLQNGDASEDELAEIQAQQEQELANLKVEEEKEIADLSKELEEAESKAMKEEIERQSKQVASGADPTEELARLKAQQEKEKEALQKEMDRIKRNSKDALQNRLKQRRAHLINKMKEEGASQEEIESALAALEAEEERDRLELQMVLAEMEAHALAQDRLRQAVATGTQVDAEAEKAALLVRQKQDALAFNQSMEAEARRRKARLKEKLANRKRAKRQELEDAGKEEEHIKMELAKIDEAGKKEEELLMEKHQEEVDREKSKREAQKRKAMEDAATAAESLNDLHQRHDDAQKALKASLKSQQDLKRANLKRKLEERRLAKQKELEQKGVDKQAEEEAMKELEKSEEAEMKEMDSNHEKEAENALIALSEEQAKEKEELLDDLAPSKTPGAELDGEAARRLREKNRKHLEDLDSDLENQRRRKQKALQERLAKRRQEIQDSDASEEEKAKMFGDLEDEEAALLRELEEALLEAQRAALEEEISRQQQTEEEARRAAEEAHALAQDRIKALKEGNEADLKRLENQLHDEENLKRTALQKRLAARRDKKQREAQSAEELAEIKRKLLEEEERQKQELEDQLAEDHEAKMREEKRRQLELEKKVREEESALAEMEAQAAAQRQADAEAKLRDLRRNHDAQAADLDEKLKAARRSKEAKLKERLAQKRAMAEQKAQEEEAKQAELERLAEEEAAQVAQLQQQLRAEEERLQQEQKAKQELEERRAAEAAQRALEAAQRAQAVQLAMQEAKEEQEKEERKDMEAQMKKLRAKAEEEHKKIKETMSGDRMKQNLKLQERLAARKAQKQLEAAKKLEMEKAKLLEEQRAKKAEEKIVKRAEQVEKGEEPIDEDWEPKVAEIVDKYATRDDLNDQEKEQEILAEAILNKKLVPTDKYSEAVEYVLQPRHTKETSTLLANQLKERSAAMRESLSQFFNDKKTARQALLESFKEEVLDDEAKKLKFQELEEKWSDKQREVESQALAAIETGHLDGQLQLRQKHLNELSSLVLSMSSDDERAEAQAVAAAARAQEQAELEAYRSRIEDQKAARKKKLEEEKKRFEEDMARQLEEEQAKAEEEQRKMLEEAKKDQDAKLESRKEKLRAQKEAAAKIVEAREEGVMKDKKEMLMQRAMDDAKEHQEKGKAEMLKKREALRRRLEEKKKAKLAKLEKEKESKNAQSNQQEEETLAQEEAMKDDHTHPSERPAEKETTDQVKSKQPGPEVDEEDIPTKVQGNLLALTASAPLTTMKSKRRASLGSIPVRQLNTSDGLPGLHLQRLGALGVAGKPSGAPEPMHWIKEKLDSIENILHTLDKAQRIANKKAAEARKKTEQAKSEVSKLHTQTKEDISDKDSVDSGSQPPVAVYQDPKEPTLPIGDLEVVDQSELPERIGYRGPHLLKFGQHILSLLKVSDIQINIAKSLRATNQVHNAFGNSYLYQSEPKKMLFILDKRCQTSGEFGLVLVHALSHIKANPFDLSNDADPKFMGEFFQNIKILHQDLYKTRTKLSMSGNEDLGGGVSPRTTPRRGSFTAAAGRRASLTLRGVQKFQLLGSESSSPRKAEQTHKRRRSSVAALPSPTEISSLLNKRNVQGTDSFLNNIAEIAGKAGNESVANLAKRKGAKAADDLFVTDSSDDEKYNDDEFEQGS